MQGEHEGRDQGNVMKSQGTPKLTREPQGGQQHGTDSPSQPTGGANPADTLTLDVQPLQL